MARKRWYSDDDIELAKTALSELPDLSTQRKSLPDFLAAISDDIQALVKTKGYSVADIKSTLASAGYEIGEKAIREILQKNVRRTGAKERASSKKMGRHKYHETWLSSVRAELHHNSPLFHN